MSVQKQQFDRHSDLMGFEPESLPPLSKTSAYGSSYESWVPYELPDIHHDLVIGEWSHVATGTHGAIRKVHMQFNSFIGEVCLKLFSEDWKDAYDREIAAYALMVHRKIKRCIPTVYFKGTLPISVCNGRSSLECSNTLEGEDEVYHGIVVEYFDDF